MRPDLIRICLFSCAFGVSCRSSEAPAAAASKGVDRIVTLAPSLTDVVVALGAGDRIVGVTTFDDAPEVAKATRVGGYSDPSFEAILRLHPDLVICQPSPGNRSPVQAVSDAGVPVKVFALQTLVDVGTVVREVGVALGLEDRASRLTRELEAATGAARLGSLSRKANPTFVVLVGTDPFVAAAPGAYTAEILTLAGGRNLVAASTTPYPTLTAEHLLSLRPDLLLVTDGMGQDTSRVPAEFKARTQILRHPGFLRPGPAAVGALAAAGSIFDAFAVAAPK